jgi:flavin-dependent dehydrogenase
MAATIAHARGYDKSRVKEDHRLGSEAAEAEAATWRTFAVAYIRRDGSGYVTVKRDGKVIHSYEFEAE